MSDPIYTHPATGARFGTKSEGGLEDLIEYITWLCEVGSGDESE